MASFSAGTTFTDGVANDVTAAKLAALVNAATPTSGLIQDRTAETTIDVNDTLLVGDASDSNNLKRMTVANFAGTLPTATITSGTITTLNSTTGTITTGVIPTLTSSTATFGTTTSTAATITSGTITNLASTTGTIATLNSTTGTIATGVIPTLTSTTLITTGTGTAAAPAIVPTGDTNTGIFFPAADTIAFSEGGTESMRIDSSGNVGIGTTSVTSNYTLDTRGWIRSQHPSGDCVVAAIAGNTTGVSAIYFGDSADDNPGSIEYNHTSNSLLVSVNATERLRIDSSGNVGIGTATAHKTLTVGSNDATAYISAGGNNVNLTIASIGSNGSVIFKTGGTNGDASTTTERLRIEAAGTLTSQPTYDNTAAGSTVIVTSAGLIRRTSSSLKYKKDIENLDSSIVDNAIDKLRPVWYRTKNPEGDDKSTWSHVGLIAEEVDSVEPRLVRYKTVEVSTNENGERIQTQLENPIPEDVDYAKLSVILLSELKNQKERISLLESRILSLESA